MTKSAKRKRKIAENTEGAITNVESSEMAIYGTQDDENYQ
jgi:hypothetical protein